MSWIDWIVLCGTLLFIFIYGMLKSRKQSNLDEFILGDRTSPWWKVGLAVMATQASAITFISTTGQGFSDGLRFVQFYFGLPIAMFVICIVFIPVFYRLKVYTAYEYLEQRFDLKTRIFAALIFLTQRGLAAGVTLYAPSIILSLVFGWNLQWTHVITGIIVIIYTLSGGAKAVTVTQLQQVTVIFLGMAFIFGYLIYSFPPQISFHNALQIAGWNNKMNGVDFHLDFNNRYNFWAGITGGFFLALAYFGTDQSQVQRYLGGKNISESRLGLIMNGLLKIPMQIFILMCGVLLFVFFQFQKTPLSYNTKTNDIVAKYEPDKFKSWQSSLDSIHNKRMDLLSSFSISSEHELKSLNVAQNNLKHEFQQHVKSEYKDLESNDKDYIFLYYILHFLPVGFIGLLIAVILCAAMSSISAELNALAGTTTVDIYKRLFANQESSKSDVYFSKIFTMGWGLIAISFAFVANLFENLIQFINIIGSLFYGSVLGIFLVAFMFKWIKGSAVFVAACCAQVVTIVLFYYSDIGFLWYNVISCCIVIVISSIIQFGINSKKGNTDVYQI